MFFHCFKILKVLFIPLSPQREAKAFGFLLTGFSILFIVNYHLFIFVLYRKDFYVNMQVKSGFFIDKNSSFGKNGCLLRITAIIL